jgi:hypothetical protein
MKYPFLPRWKLKASTQRVSTVDIVTNALFLSFSMSLIVTVVLLLLKLFLQKCPVNRVPGVRIIKRICFGSLRYLDGLGILRWFGECNVP